MLERGTHSRFMRSSPAAPPHSLAKLHPIQPSIEIHSVIRFLAYQLPVECADLLAEGSQQCIWSAAIDRRNCHRAHRSIYADGHTKLSASLLNEFNRPLYPGILTKRENGRCYRSTVDLCDVQWSSIGVLICHSGRQLLPFPSAADPD